MKGSRYKKLLAVSLAVSLSVTMASSGIFASDTGHALEIEQDAGWDTGNGTVSDDTLLGDPEDLSSADTENEKNNAQTNVSGQEDQYESIEIIPRRTVYYIGSGDAQGDDDDPSGGHIGDDMYIELHKKDGTTESYDNWSSLPYADTYGGYGLRLDGSPRRYTDIETFIAEGGTAGEQTVEVSYCGMTASYTVTLEEAPYEDTGTGQEPDETRSMGNRASTSAITTETDSVESIKVAKDPDKIMYFSERDNQVDLYGMILSVNYTDGRTETISFNDHTNGSNPKVETSIGTVEAVLTGSWGERSLEITYRDKKCVIPLKKTEWETADPVKMGDQGDYPTVLTEDKPYCVYSFCPSETKLYNFFSYSSTSVETYVELFDENDKIGEDTGSGGNNKFCLSQTLSANTDYYFVVSNRNFGTEADFTCYLSSTISSLSDLGVKELDVTKAPKDTWYDFETGLIRADSLKIKGTEYEVTYDNGWKRTEKVETGIDAGGTKADIRGKTLSVEWKYTFTDGGYTYVDKNREGNALIYTYDGRSKEIPVSFNAPNPVKSITVTGSPWGDWKPYQYVVSDKNLWPSGNVTLELKYTNGASKTVTWHFGDSGFDEEDENGYWMRVDIKGSGDIQTGSENAVVISYMGREAEIPITVVEDPVGSIKILREPEKKGYYPFEETVDLNGMNAEITYKDGKKQIVEVSENTATPTVPATEGCYGGKLTSFFGPSKTVWISYMGYTQELASCKKRGFTEMESIKLEAGKEQEIVLSDEIPYQIFSFTPPGSAAYKLSWSHNGYYDADINIYNAANKELAHADSFAKELPYEMIGGQSYYIALIYKGESEQNYTDLISINKQADTEEQEISEIPLLVDGPSAGMALPDLAGEESEQYYISEWSWLNDEEDDGIADYGKKHQFKAVLRTKVHPFASSIKVTVNGKNVTDRSLSSNGDLTICYTFPSYTKFKITIPKAEGYTLDESQNTVSGEAGYGLDYIFRYIKDKENDSNSELIVKVGDTVLTPNENGYYVIENITQNTTVTVKRNDMTADSDESRLTLYNRSSSVLDVLIGRLNHSLSDNETGEKTLPVLESYSDGGEDQFFFGWYQEKDPDWNGTGTRFTSQSILAKPEYSLYARWGKGTFSHTTDQGDVNCKIISIDESDGIKVEIGKVPVSEDGTVQIPAKIDWNENADLKGLGIGFSDCSVTAISDNAFSGDSAIGQVILPDTLEKIGENAFKDCTGLQEISIPASVDTVPEGAFQGCTGLTHVRLEEGVTKIDANAFSGCNSLQTIVLPDTLEEVGESAFDKNENKNINLVCSDAKKETPVIKAVEEMTGVSAVAIDVKIEPSSDSVQFTEDDPAKTFTASVSVNGVIDPDRKITWKYPDTQDHYQFEVNEEENSLTVTPLQVTADGVAVTIQAVDEGSGKYKAVTLTTIANDDPNTPTGTPTVTPSGTPTGTPTVTPSVTPTATPSVTPTGTPSATPTGTPTVTPMPSTTPIPTGTITPAPQPKASQVLKSRYDSKGKRLKVKAGSRLTQVITGAETNITFGSSNTKIAKVGKTTGVIRFVGVGKVVITAKAAESKEYRAASKKTTFYVIPKTAKVRALRSNKKGQVTVKGRNGAKDNDGYQIQYKQNGKTRKVIVKGKRSVTKTFKNLRSGKTFKVRMRAYKKVGNVTYYGKYGKWKTLKRVK